MLLQFCNFWKFAFFYKFLMFFKNVLATFTSFFQFLHISYIYYFANLFELLCQYIRIIANLFIFLICLQILIKAIKIFWLPIFLLDYLWFFINFYDFLQFPSFLTKVFRYIQMFLFSTSFCQFTWILRNAAIFFKFCQLLNFCQFWWNFNDSC